MDTAEDQPVSTPRRRGRPPKTSSSNSCGKERTQSPSEANAACQNKVITPVNNAGQVLSHSEPKKRGRPPKSASKDNQINSKVDLHNKDVLSTLCTPTNQSNKSENTTPVPSSGRRSGRTPKPVVNKDFITPTSSLKSSGKPGLLERDSQAVAINPGSNNLTSSPNVRKHEACNSLAFENIESKRQDGPVSSKRLTDTHTSEIENNIRKGRRSTQTKVGPVRNEWPQETELSTKSDNELPKVHETPGNRRSSKSSFIEGEKNNLNNSVDNAGDATKLSQNDVVINPSKKKRGRPRKQQSLEALETSMNTSDNTPDSAKKKVPLVLSGKRKRVPSQKYAEDDSESETGPSADSVESLQAKKRKSRPQRFSKAKKKDYADDEQDSEDEFDMDKDSEGEEEVTVLKSKRGRKKKQVAETSDSEDEPTPKQKKTDSKKDPQSAKGKSEKVLARKCVLCGNEFKDLATIKRHMMVAHSLVYTKENPEGVQNSYLIVKILGYIDCQRCSKKFRGGQYYNFHTIWCGREEEMAECEICKRPCKAMWLQQHLTAHRTAQKKLEIEKQEKEERARKKLEAKGEESEQEEGGRIKRKAAKSALKHLSQVKEGDDGEGLNGSDGDSYKESGNESSETDDEGEDEDMDSEGDGKRNRKCRPGRRYLPYWRMLFDSLWRDSCQSDPHTVQEFHDRQSQQSLFTDLQPLKDEWKPLNSRDRTKYLPDPGGCIHVCTSMKKMQSSEVKLEESETIQHTLSFGQTCTAEGYSISFAGAPIRALEWCPLPRDSSSDQVVSVVVDWLDISAAPVKTTAGPGMVQFWSIAYVNDEKLDESKSSDSCTNHKVFLRCCLAHDAGRVRSMAWCSWRPSEESQKSTSDNYFPRLGLLALACSNGTVQVFSIPQLHSLPAAEFNSGGLSSTMVVKPKPSLSLELKPGPNHCGQCISVAWQQSGQFRYIAAGYSTGVIAIWDLQNASPLLRSSQVIRPLRCFLVHAAPVLSLAFCPQLPHLLASSSQDFTVCLTDINRPGALLSDKRHIHPNIVRSVRWAGPIYLGLFLGEESLVISNECGVRYTGLCQMSMGRKMDAEFLIHNNAATTWDVDICPYSSLAVSCDANGKVKIILLDMDKLWKEQPLKNQFNSYEVMFCPGALLYQVRVDSNHISTQAAVSLSKQGFQELQPESRTSKALSSSSSLETSDNQSEAQPSSLTLTSKTQTIPVLSKTFVKNDTVNFTNHQARTVSDENGASMNGEILNSRHSFGSKDTKESTLSHHTKVGEQIENKEFNAINKAKIAAVKSSTSANQTFCADTAQDSTNQTSDKNHSSDIGSSKITVASVGIIHKHCQNGQQIQTEESREEACKKESASERAQLNLNEGLETVYFESFKEAKFNDLATAKQEETLENLANPNNQLAHKVRLNPNFHHCAWLACGGQSGLLRIDDLSHILKSNRPVIEELRLKSKS